MPIFQEKSTWYFLQSPTKFFLTIILFMATYFAIYHNDYLQYYPINGTVIGHQTGYRNHLYLIVQTETHGTLDREVSPALYHTTKDGDQLSFNLREMDINQSTKKNILYLFVPVILQAVSTSYVIVQIGCIVWRRLT